MSDLSFLSDDSRMNYGYVLRTTVDCGRITAINIPHLPDGCGIIDHRSFQQHKNIIPFGDDLLPILLYPRVRYKGQPILLVYAPSPEEAEVLASLIKVSYNQQEPQAPKVIKTLSFSSPDFDTLEGIQISPPMLISKPVCLHRRRLIQSTSYFDTYHNLVVHSQSSWIHHTQRAISTATGVALPRVIVYRSLDTSIHGEGFVENSVLSLLAAMVTSITGGKSHISMPLIINTPEIRVEYRFIQNKEKQVLGVHLVLTLDMGATTVFSEEILNAIMHQIAIPLGELPMQVDISILRSHNPPAYPPREFFSSIGASIRDILIRDLSITEQITPVDWFLRHYKEESIQLFTGQTLHTPMLDQAIQDVVRQSDYQRKYNIYTAYSAQDSSYISKQYARGIGFAGGPANHGPTTITSTQPWQVRVTLTDNEEISIETGLSTADAIAQWTYLSKKILSIPRGSVTIKQSGTIHLPDSGPDFQERDKTVVTVAIQKALQKIKRKRKTEELPITATVTIPRKLDDTNLELFFTWGAVVVELSIDDLSLIPFIRGVWITAPGQVWEKHRLEGAIQEAVLLKYHELIDVENYRDLCFRHRQEVIPIHLNLIQSSDQFTSPLSVVETFFPAAFLQALPIALGSDINHLPLNPRDIAALKERP